MRSVLSLLLEEIALICGQLAGGHAAVVRQVYEQQINKIEKCPWHKYLTQIPRFSRVMRNLGFPI